MSLKNEQKEYDIFLPGRTPDVLLDKGKGRGSDSDDESIPVKGKGRGKKGKGKDKSKGKGKGKGKFNPTLVHPDHIDPLKLAWKPVRREEIPVKGLGRNNYRALRSPTLYNWLYSLEHQRVIEEGGDVDSIQINLEDYALPNVTPSVKKPKDTPKRQREQPEDPETKRIKKGGPLAIPPTWRNKDPQELVMSFTSPEVRDGYILVVLQASSQLPAFGRYCIPLPADIRDDRVLDNPMGHEFLWAPVTKPFWEPCRKKNILQFGMAASHSECSLCPGAKAYELVPCCWCTNWIHVRCSYAVPEGRACASHFDVVNPLDKQVVASMEDDTLPQHFRGRSVCPNIATPKTIEQSEAPKHVMYGIEALWMYKHAWRGAGLYYRRGDHQVPKPEAASKPPSMYKALSMYPVWDKWLMPRREPIAERFYSSPKKWSLSEYDDDNSFVDTPPSGYVRFEYQILENLKFEG